MTGTDRPFILFAHSAYRLGEAYEARQGRCPHVHVWSKADLLPRLGEADVLCLSGFWDNSLLDRMPQVRFIQLCSAGYDHFDIEALRARGIRLANAAGANANAVSEHAFALLLALTRRMAEARDNQVKRHWRGMISELDGREDELAGKTMLVVGLGRIGRRIARIAKAFDMRVLGIRRTPGTLPEVDHIGGPGDLRALLAGTDVLVLACPLSAETRGLIDAEMLTAMKPSAYLVNVARGPVVDEPALISALAEHRIAGAGIDVTAVEPLDATSPLWSLDTVVLTPHTAGETRRHEANVIELLIGNLGRLERGEPLLNGVV
ncbi:MAG: D-2-hydroxyacid dehydrogenase [Hyphomicrobiaceae bacterium]